MIRWLRLASPILVLIASPVLAQDPPPMSEASETCLMCHEVLHPGIVSGWKSSRHAEVTPAMAAAVEGLGRKVSSEDVPEELTEVVVGCAECHTLRPGEHADTFDHNGEQVHIVVSPKDCAVCHAVESAQYSQNIMAHAHGNLENNAVYQDLQRHVLGAPTRIDGELSFAPPDADTKALGASTATGPDCTLRASKRGIRTWARWSFR